VVVLIQLEQLQLLPNNTVSAASSTPTLCINTALTAITHTTTGATGIGTATGLPSGVTAALHLIQLLLVVRQPLPEHLATFH
jgi:hypothetical protein